MELPDSLNNAISYSWVLGWYAGRDGATTDNGKMQATKDIKEKHPDIVKACDAHDDLLALVRGYSTTYPSDSYADKAAEVLAAAEPN